MWRCPNSTATVCLHYLSNDPKTAMIPFIFLTSRDGAEEMRRGMSSGADDYLVKPFSEADLLATIEVRLKKSAILQREYGRPPQRLNEFIADAIEQGGIPGIDVGDGRGVSARVRFSFLRGRHQQRVLRGLGSGQGVSHRQLRQGADHRALQAGDFLGPHGCAQRLEYTSAAEVLEDAEVHLIPRKVFLD